MARSRIHSVFQKLISAFKEQTTKIAEAQQGPGQRVWQAPDDWVGDPFNIAETHKPAFDRQEINTNYLELHAKDSEAGVGDAGSLKIQLDYTAVAERAFRSRHASNIRCLAHTSARLTGHGSDAGVFAHTQNYAQDLGKAAGA